MLDEGPPAASGLTYTDNVSITWKPVQYQPDESHLALVNASNEAFLRAVSVIGEHGAELPEGSSVVAQEIVRLDLKLNLLLDLVSQLIYQQLEIPETSSVTVSSSGIEWRGDVPQPGTTVFIQLYIQRGTPKPLCFYGRVVSTAQEYDEGLAKLDFLGLCGSAQAWLDKLIFRHHRREVAFRKSSKTSD